MLEHYLDLAQPWLHRYGYLAVFMAVMIEGFGVPAPGETLVIASGLLAARGSMSVAVLPLAWLAAVIGDNIGYAIGRLGGRRLILRYGARFGMQAARVQRVENFLARFGGGFVATARFFDVLRQLNGVVAGLGGLRWWSFLAWNALGAALWVGVWGGGSYFLGDHLAPVIGIFRRWEPYFTGAGLAVIAATLVYLLRRRHRPPVRR